jgi:hypothetical protein
LTAAAQALGVERAVAKQLLANGVLRGQAVGGGPQRVLKTVDKASLAALVAEASARVSAAQLAEQYGIKSSWILDMAALGLIELAESAFIDIAYRETQLRKSSATAYLSRIVASIVRTEPGDPERLPLGEAFLLLGPGPKPWLQAIMAPKMLPDGLGSFEPSGVNCSALNVSRRCARMLQSGSFTFPPVRLLLSSEVTLAGAQEHLNCYPRDIADLIKLGLLVRSHKRLCLRSVEKCGRALISTRELAGRSQTPALLVAAVAQQKGLLRPYQGTGFWDREQAEAMFDLSPVGLGRASA